MKKILLITIAFIAYIGSTHAQVQFGLKAGISTLDIDPSEVSIADGAGQNLKLSLAEAKYGFHAGIFTYIPIGPLFLQPEVLMNTSKVEYELKDLSFSEVRKDLFSESYTNLDIPVLVGLKLGPLRLNGGPVGHLHLNSKSELTEVEGYSQKFAEMTYGWQAGLGLDIGRLRIDARYEGNFNKFGDHINFGDTAYQFDDSPGRFMVSAGYAFGKKR